MTELDQLSLLSYWF